MTRPDLRLIAGGRRRRVVAGLALVVAVAVVTTVVMTAGSPSPSSASSRPSAAGAATVRRRNLVETDTEAGTLSYSDPQTVYDRISGTITWLPRVGQLIKPGGALYDVNGEPVILMNGSTPAYRTLSASADSGSDVLQLNRNLVEMGFNADGITVDDVWQPGTTLGVELLQESLGDAETGSLQLGQIVFLPGAQLVSAVDGTVGATGSGGGAAATSAVTPVRALAPEFVSLTVSDRRSAGEPAVARTRSTTTVGSISATTPTSPTLTTPTTTTTPTAGTPAAGTPTPGTPTTSTPTATTPTDKKPAGGSSTGGGDQVSARTLAALTALLKAEAAQLKAETAELNAARHASATVQGGAKGKSGSSGSGNGAKSSSGSGSGSGLGSGSTSADSGGGSAAEILQTTSTRLVVTVDLSASSQSEAEVGERVTVEMPAGDTVEGRITAVSPVAQSSSGSGNGSGGSGESNGGGGGGGPAGGSSSSSSTIPVTITLSGHHVGVGLDQAAVSVSFAEQRAANVLSVPVTALLATGGGNYAVQEAAAPHRLLPVTTGLFAAGYVQISGRGIHSGLQVTDSQG